MTNSAGSAVLLALLLLPIGASAQVIELTEDNFDIGGMESRQERHLGRDALFLRNANAVLKDLEFYNGTIEFDAAVTGERGFTSIRWRRSPDASGENFLIRNHQSGERDSAQYEAFHGYRSSWQLYNHDGYTTPIDIPLNEWIHFKIVVKDRAADIYVNSDVPIIHVSELRGRDVASVVQINAALSGAWFSEFRVDSETPDSLVGASMNLPQPPDIAGAIRHWSLSDTIPNGSFDDITELPQELDVGEWTDVSTDRSGVINLSEYRPADGFNGPDADRTTAVVKTNIHSDRSRVLPVIFGYSDRIRIYLNREILYAGENRFRPEDRRYQGLVSRDDQVFLNLARGNNELIMVVQEDDRFGWGFLTELASLEGLTLQ